MENKITVKEAARLMRTSEIFIRIGLQRNILPFGIAMKMPNSTKYTYYISKKQFYKYIGKK